MWLPAPVYERIPQIWFLFGLMFIAYGFYIGIDIAGSLVCIAAGVLCCLIGVGVAVFRKRVRGAKSSATDTEAVE